MSSSNSANNANNANNNIPLHSVYNDLPMAAAMAPVLQGATEADMRALLSEKIVFILTIYPRLMPSMLQVGIGPHINSRRWKPLVDQLIKEGKVVREEIALYTPSGQYRSYGVLRLADHMPKLNDLMNLYQQKVIDARRAFMAYQEVEYPGAGANTGANTRAGGVANDAPSAPVQATILPVPAEV
jgi:hypothetical protein